MIEALSAIGNNWVRILLSRLQKRRLAWLSLLGLIKVAQERDATDVRGEVDWSKIGNITASLNDRLGRAGFLTRSERQWAIYVAAGLVALITTCSMVSWWFLVPDRTLLIPLAAGIYLGLVSVLLLGKLRSRAVDREVMFELPVFLESLILLVESGFGLLPALERIIDDRASKEKASVLTRILSTTVKLSTAGVPFPVALETVAVVVPYRAVRHILLHLDMSATDGAEMIPALRSLSDHAFSEWRLSVEHRVRRLENWVVFPVFGAVIGLLILLSAVPLIPLISLNESLSGRAVDRSGPSVSIGDGVFAREE